MKEITIKIFGTVGSGKSTIQYHVINELRKLGFEVEFIPNNDYETEEALNRSKQNTGWDNYKIKVETVQLNRVTLD